MFFKKINRYGFQKLCIGLLGICLISCGLQGIHHEESSVSGKGLPVSATFGPDGRLWRVMTDKSHVYVDSSRDLGKTFSAATTVNSEDQRIKASAENRPVIAVAPTGVIVVAYAAEGRQPQTTFNSVSLDAGAHFSEPTTLSSKADEANTLQPKLAVSQQGRVMAFWHDERDRTDWKLPGNAIYFAEFDAKSGKKIYEGKSGDMVCECCRIAADFDNTGSPVLLVRNIYPGGNRDHGLIKTKVDGKAWEEWRVTFDDWRIEACPEQGPSLSIAADGRYHIAWFTQGNVRKGLFYANSNDHGRTFSKPLTLAGNGKLADHPAVLSVGNTVSLVWKEFDGVKTSIVIRQSRDGGETWSTPKQVAETVGQGDSPMLISKDRMTYLSWNTQPGGYRLISLD